MGLGPGKNPFLKNPGGEPRLGGALKNVGGRVIRERCGSTGERGSPPLAPWRHPGQNPDPLKRSPTDPLTPRGGPPRPTLSPRVLLHIVGHPGPRPPIGVSLGEPGAPPPKTNPGYITVAVKAFSKRGLGQKGSGGRSAKIGKRS